MGQNIITFSLTKYVSIRIPFLPTKSANLHIVSFCGTLGPFDHSETVWSVTDFLFLSPTAVMGGLN